MRVGRRVPEAPQCAGRHLTPPSSGRLKGRFAPFAPPLMSNVRSHLSLSLSLSRVSLPLASGTACWRGFTAVTVTRRARCRVASGYASRALGVHAQTRRTGTLERLGGIAACILSVCSSAMASSRNNSCTATRRVRTLAAGCRQAQGATVASNHSIERTAQSPLRALWSAAHVER